MQFHQIKSQSRFKKSKRVARGGKRGGYSGRGIKGQKSRAGAKIRPAARDLFTKFPKARGRAKHSFKSRMIKPAILNLSVIEKNFKNGEIVNPDILFGKGLVGRPKKGHLKVKILGDGEISKKLSFQKVLLSNSARAKIEKAGGSAK